MVLSLTALWDSISVYIRLSPREREKEKRNERGEKKCKNNPTRTYCKCSRPLAYSNPFVGRPGTGSLLSGIAPPGYPPPPPLPTQKQMDNRRHLLTVMQCRAGQSVLSQDRSRKAKMPIPLNTAKRFIHQFQQFVCVFIYVPSVTSKKKKKKKQQLSVMFFFST